MDNVVSITNVGNQEEDIKETGIIVEEESQYIHVTELVPATRVLGDNMETVAIMTEQFEQVIDPILKMYSAAVSEATSRIEIIKDEFRYRKKRCPIHHIDTRIKSSRSILGKLRKKNLDLSINAACNNIFDIAGIRVVCPYIKDVYEIRDRILAQDDIQIMNIKDYIEQPKNNGYRSFHMVIRVPIYFMNKKQMVPVEIQIRTLAMDLWASLEHDIMYKAIGNADYDFSEQLLECSKLIYKAEDQMEKMNEMLEE